jgi:hypothetical protein
VTPAIGDPAIHRRARLQPLRLALAAALLAASVGQSECADLKIVDIKAYVFLERDAASMRRVSPASRRSRHQPRRR